MNTRLIILCGLALTLVCVTIAFVLALLNPHLATTLFHAVLTAFTLGAGALITLLGRRRT
ncbi:MULTISPECIES: hypothetical protein [unclassified Beijerinckia]|uniref:hypothetical protein n=1 Tax=unclassified Beijerinckia TaxID=2638183 RepID=UPI0008976A50|nr:MULTISPECIES: hypothetical protein [unclassified Beijerinckia]MDH7796451.1 hypothetical protein [Beijerinckia sp. GAS462]SEC45661.1 hypothetical protein SAMN05443249_2733 [Beijerinckia sp. 28-YEA-48]